jgi:ABC-type oligopeptide transport system substrate-binding subunit
MPKRLSLSIVMLTIGAGLLVAAGYAGPATSRSPQASSGVERVGGTYRMSLTTDIDYVDPALAYYVPTWTIEYATCAMLLTYPDAPAPRGSTLVPEVAAGFPRISRDGKTYTFTLKRTYRLSNGQRITAANFAWAINRALQKPMASPAQPFIEDVVGAKEVIEGTSPRASGVKVLSPYKLQLRLSRRAPDLLARLSMPFFCAIPTNLPVNADGVQAPVVGSGPYFISEWTPKRQIVLERNRFYRGPRPHSVSRIVYDIGLPLETIRLNVESGRSDYAADGLPPAAHAELGNKYGTKKRSPGRYFVNPAPTFRYLAMNHDRPLFGGGALGNVRLKKAVNFAIDRGAMIRQRGAFAGIPTDQYLPKSMRGYREATIYPSRPNTSRALQLARGQTREGNGVFYCANRSPAPETCQIAQANLEQIGLKFDIKLFPRAVQFTKTGNKGEPFDLTLEGWHMDYFDPYDFIFLVDGTTIRPANNVNFSYFNSPRYNRKIAQASAMIGAERYRAFGSLDVDLARNAAPLAAYINDNDRHFVSAQTGCYIYHPVYTFDLPRICLTR